MVTADDTNEGAGGREKGKQTGGATAPNPKIVFRAQPTTYKGERKLGTNAFVRRAGNKERE